METYKPGEVSSEGMLLETEDEEIELDILSEMNAAPGDTTYSYRVGRITGASSKGAGEPILFKGDGTDVDKIYDRLRDEYGDGKYRIRIMKNGRMWKRFDMAIELPKTTARNPMAAPQSDMAAVLAAIEKSNERTLQLIERLAQRDPLPATAPDNSLAMIDRVISIVQKINPPRPPDDMAAKSVELILKGMDLADRAGGGREKGMFDLVSDLLQSPLLAKIAEGTQTPQIALPPRLPNRQVIKPTPQANGKDTPPAPEPTQEQMAAAQAQQMRNIVVMLNTRALHGSSFETYAEWAFDSLPPPLIMQLLAQPDPYQVLLAVAPEIAPQEQWFKSLIDDLRELVNDANAAGDINGDASRAEASPIGPIGNPEWSGGDTDNSPDDG